MKRSWAAIAVVFVALCAATSCNDYGNTFQADTGAQVYFVSPSNLTACVATATTPCPNVTLTVTGAGFVIQTYVTWDQAKLATCVITTDSGTSCATSSDTGAVISVSAVLPGSNTTTAKVGRHFVQTQNPYSGTGQNGLSNPVAFFINPPSNPVPTITSISPNTAAAGSANTAITITGTNFLPTSDPSGGSQVNWNTTTQAALTVTSISSTQIQATVTAAELANAGNATVTVYNPPAPLTTGCTPGVNCGGNGGGGTSPCPLVTGSTTVTVCNFTITGPGGNNANSAQVQGETPAISLDGRYVAYAALQNGHSQIFARDTCQGAPSSCQPSTLLISTALDGTPGSDDSHAPSMSSDGRYVAFSSASANLVAESATTTASTGRQVYLRDTCFGAGASCTPSTQLISTDPNGALGGTESILPSVSSSGRFVAFLAVTQTQAGQASSTAKKSAATTTNSGYSQVFVRDTCLGAANCTPATTRISLQPADSSGSSTKPAGPAISGSASNVALAGESTATLFTRSLAVDDGVFLALTKSQP